MKVQCEKCQAEYNIDESRVPPEGLQIKCPRCMATFVVARGGAVPETAGDLFDLGGDDGSLELNLPEEPAYQPTPAPMAQPPAGASLPSLGGSSLPQVGMPGGEAAAPQPSPGSEGQIFDFIDHEIGTPASDAEEKETRYRIRRKSGKVFGPFDAATVQRMLAEHQLMGNEEASTDGRSFKPMGSFDEFAATIRALMDGPAGGVAPPPAAVIEGVDDDDELVPKGIEFADPAPVEGKAPRRSGLSIGLGLVVVLLVLIGLALGFTRLGFFGLNLVRGGEGMGDTGVGGGEPGGEAVSTSRSDFFEDSFAGYSSVLKDLEAKVKAGDDEVEDLYLLGLSYAAMLRNYGANAVYLQRGQEIAERLRDAASDSPERRKVDAAFLILTSPAKARADLEPLLSDDRRDKEALFLAGWAMAYQKDWREAAKLFDRAIVIDPDFAKAYHALGDLQSLQADFENAALFYEKALEKNPRHIQSAVEQARIAVEVNSDDARGEELLTQVFSKNFGNLSPSERAKAHHLRALINIHRHANDKVVQDLNAAIELMPSRVAYLAALGNFFLDMGEFAKAVEMFDQALSKDPEDIDSQVGKGRAMWQAGDIVKAKMALEATSSQAPDDPRPLYFLGRISEDLDKPEEAARLYEQATTKSASFLLARVALARLQLKQNKVKEALDQLTAASQLNPRSALVRNGLGEVYLAQSNLRLAESEFREALKLEAELPSAHFNLANTLRETGHHDEANAEYEKVAVLSPRFPNLELEHGYNLYLQKKYDEALKMYEGAIRANPKDDALYVRAGLAAKAAGDSSTATKYFQSATGLNSTNAEAYFQLALIFQENKDHDQALDLLKQAAAIDKTKAEYRFRIGVSYQAIEMMTDAIDEFRAAIKLDPGHVGALSELGKALLERSQFEEAVSHLNRVVREQPDRLDVLLAIGDAYAKQNQFTKALASYKRALTKNPKLAGGAYRMGRAFDELNKKQQAIQYYLQAVKVDAEDPMPHYYLGHVYKAINKNRLALAEFKRYLQLRPDAPDADDVRDEISYMEQE